jgi:site-specific DNA recombinase
MKKGVLLARVSTLRQEKEGLSLDDIQLPELRRYAKEHGIEIAAENEFVFSESADQKMRKRFNEMVAKLKKHPELTEVVAYKVDRITRNYRDAVICDELRKDYGKQLHFVYNRLIINKDSSGRDIADWDTQVYLAKQQINRLRDDALDSARTMLKMGKKPGKAPLGYKNITLADERKDIITDPPRSELIKEIFELYSTGAHSYKSIALIMREKGLRTDSGNVLYRSKIEQIIDDPFYYGFIRHQGKLYPHNYPRLTKETTFKRCQEIKLERTQKGNFKPQYKVFSFRGIIQCAYCGTIIGLDTKKNGRLRYMQCNKAQNPTCPQPRLHESTILKQVKDDVVTHLKVPDDAVVEVQDEVIRSFQVDTGSNKERAKYLMQQISDSKTLILESYKDLKRGNRGITQEMYDQIVSEEEVRQSGWEDELANFDEPDESLIVSSEYLLSLLNRLPELYERSKDDEKLEWHKLWFSNTSLKQEKLHWELKKPFDAVHSCSKTQVWLPRLDSDQRRPR